MLSQLSWLDRFRDELGLGHIRGLDRAPPSRCAGMLADICRCTAIWRSTASPPGSRGGTHAALQSGSSHAAANAELIDLGPPPSIE
jgi:hypothetical protein